MWLPSNLFSLGLLEVYSTGVRDREDITYQNLNHVVLNISTEITF